jgi:signal transduction histidine kinase
VDNIEVFGSLDPAGPASEGKRISILLSVCDPTARAAARATLLETSLFLEIDEVDSQEATLHALISKRYDCALIECVKTGNEKTVLDLLARVQTEIIATPVVALTDEVAEDAAAEVLKAGALDYLIKDRITPYALSQSILRAMQLARRDGSAAGASQQLISERDQAIVARDAALEASRVKSQFLAFVTHELKTPLNAILGYADLLEDELTESSLHDLADNVLKIREAGKYLGELVSDLLDLSRLEAGKLRLVMAPVQIAEAISEATVMVAPLLDANGNTLSLDIAPDLPVVNTDGLRLRQILINLLSNAAKFTSDGTITVRAQCSVEAGKRTLEISVADTGAGIPPDQLGQLFEPYHQIEMTRKYNLSGTGLGLTLSRLLCWALGGEILVESVLGTGSKFTVLFPVTSAGESNS